ncbi:MAG: hypothetical protein DRN99_02825 [Thermoproteota archaeon]|nr:MAG: hypothetical protein DRN99_02825 [Candidatus Korarchaeota archaeon]
MLYSIAVLLVVAAVRLLPHTAGQGGLAEKLIEEHYRVREYVSGIKSSQLKQVLEYTDRLIEEAKKSLFSWSRSGGLEAATS